MNEIPFAPPDITDKEIEYVNGVLRSGWITTGAKTKLFENKIALYCGKERAVCLNSATACLEMTLRILGIGPGDEVITSAYTYTASCSVICHVGAKPVLVDVAENSFEMDLDKLENAITSKTKAIIPVDIGGIMCDYEKIIAIVQNKKSIFRAKNQIQKYIGRVAVIADGAHCFGAKKNNQISGSVADFTCFSFHAVKNLTTSEGGAVVWNKICGVSNDEIYKNYMILSLHGQTKDAFSKSHLGAWEYDVVYPAYKCNMTDVAAAIGISQLERYEKLLFRRKQLVRLYNEILKDDSFKIAPHFENGNESSCHLYILRLTDKNEIQRNEIIKKMAKRKIATNVHYKPLPLLTAYKNLGFDIKNFSNAFKVYENEITLPLHTLLTDENVVYIAQTLKNLMH